MPDHIYVCGGTYFGAIRGQGNASVLSLLCCRWRGCAATLGAFTLCRPLGCHVTPNIRATCHLYMTAQFWCSATVSRLSHCIHCRLTARLGSGMGSRNWNGDGFQVCFYFPSNPLESLAIMLVCLDLCHHQQTSLPSTPPICCTSNG